MSPKPRLMVHTGAKAWDTIWKWTWFEKDAWQPEFRKWKEGTRRALRSLLPKLGVRSVLDCSCGLGWKTILLAEMGFDVEGSDANAFAVRHAAELAKEEGFDIRFFRSRWERLGQASGRKYDCVYNDAFAWITRRRSLRASAEGIGSTLKHGGTFVFVGAHQWSREDDTSRLIKEQFEKEGPFEVLPVHGKDGVKLITVVTREKTPDGVLESRIHVVDDHGSIRVEVARILDVCKWTWFDYVNTFREAGFRQLYSVKEKGVGPKPYILNVAVK
jgi:SAM-dependent methyltransferase